MCNSFTSRATLDEFRSGWDETRIPLRFPEGLPNAAPGDVRITDPALILRAGPDSDPANDGAPAPEAVTRRWSWPGPTGKPVYNYRSDGRDLANHGAKGGRCLVPVDGFYEFTAPEDGGKRKTRWVFSRPAPDPVGAAGAPAWFCLAGLWRADPVVGEAFTLLTCPPGPDMAPYHDRQVVVPDPADWTGWLDGSLPSQAVCVPATAGTLAVRRADRAGAAR